MSASRRQNTKRRKAVKKTVNKTRCIILLVLLVLVSMTIYTICKLTSDKVYKGVSIHGIDISSFTKEELLEQLPAMVDISEVFDITIQIEDAQETINSLSLAPVPNLEEMINEAFSYGRTKKGLARLGEISAVKKNPVNLSYKLSLDEYALQQTLDKLSDKLNVRATDNKIEIGTDAIHITRGVPGKGIVYDEVKKEITECILNDTDFISMKLTEINPEEITIDFLKRHTYAEPLDATYTIQEHRLLFTESHPGVKFNEGDVKRAIKEAKGYSKFSVPAKITQPKHTMESLRASIVGDVLGTHSSDFSSSSNDRAYNIQLACTKIDGYILAPGEEFSYNAVVGPRTTKTGFRMANVYINGTTQPGIGGGVCQVSSTMFNAVVKADLEITERRNHSLPVSYVAMGTDATVADGSIDFKFKNTYPTPIEISAEYEGRKNVITIRGINNHPERKIEIETVRTATSEPKVVTKKDPTLEEGTVKVEEKGTNGSTYVAYKVVYENGKERSRDVLCRSVYQGKDRVELVGTKKPEKSAPPESTQTPEPTTTPSPTSKPKPTSTPSPKPTATAESENTKVTAE